MCAQGTLHRDSGLTTCSLECVLFLPIVSSQLHEAHRDERWRVVCKRHRMRACHPRKTYGWTVWFLHATDIAADSCVLQEVQKQWWCASMFEHIHTLCAQLAAELHVCGVCSELQDPFDSPALLELVQEVPFVSPVQYGVFCMSPFISPRAGFVQDKVSCHFCMSWTVANY